MHGSQNQMNSRIQEVDYCMRLAYLFIRKFGTIQSTTIGLKLQLKDPGRFLQCLYTVWECACHIFAS